MPREEDISFAKDRALELIELGRPIEAGASFMSDMNKGEAGGLDMVQLNQIQNVLISNQDQLKAWIESFK